MKKYSIFLMSVLLLFITAPSNLANSAKNILASPANATASSSQWTGASTLAEFSRKIKGTTWHSEPNGRYGGVMYKFVFTYNGTVRKYTTLSSKAQWGKYIEFPYEIQQKRDSSGKNYLSVNFGDGSNLDHAEQVILFVDKCMNVMWGMSGGMSGAILKYGDYIWDDSL